MRPAVLSIASLLAGLATPAAAQYARVSVSSAGAQADGPSDAPQVSAEGRYVVFASTASNLVAGDTNGVSDVFLHDRDTDRDGIYDEPGAILTQRLSVTATGEQGNGPSTSPKFVGDLGVVFLSRATNLTPNLPSPVQRVFFRWADGYGGNVILVSQSTNGQPADSDCDGLAVGPGSARGPQVAFRSLSRTLAPGDPGSGGAIYVRGLLIENTTRRVSPRLVPDASGVQPIVSPPAMPDDGDVVFFAVVTPGTLPAGRVLLADGFGNSITDLGPGVGVAIGTFESTYLTAEATAAGLTTSRRFTFAGLPLPGPLVAQFEPSVSRLGRYAAFVGPTSTTLHDFVAGESSIVPIGGTSGSLAQGEGRWLAVASPQVHVAGDTNGVSDIVVVDLARVFDLDQDGLDDRWERLSGLDPTSAAGADGAAGDPDGDGQTNAVEFATNVEGRVQTHPVGLVHRYLAEGAENAFFHTELALANPDPLRDAAVQIRYRISPIAEVVQPVRVPPLSRRTVLPGSLGVYNTDFAVEVESDRPVVVDRRMTWDAATEYGASLETAQAASQSWYLAEGTTAGGFSLFYLLHNPQAASLSVSITYLRPWGPPITRLYELPPHSRTTIVVESVDPGLLGTDVSAHIEAGAPIVVERALYASRHGEPFAIGHVATGANAPMTNWFLAEGATGSFFDLYVLVANPEGLEADVALEFLKPDGSIVTRAITVPAFSRRTVYVDAIPGLESTPVSTRVTSTNGARIIVERSMYWPGGFFDYEEGHSSVGTTGSATRWALAAGEDGGPRSAQSYVLIANVGATAGEARVTVLGETAPNTSQVVAMPANSRVTVRVGEGRTDRFGVLVESLGAVPAAIVVEGSSYWSPNGRLWAAGGNVVATPLP